MPKRCVVVELSPSRLEVAVVRKGASVQSRAERIGVSLGEERTRSLASLSTKLRELVDALEARGASATLLYTAPGPAVGVFACPKSAGAARAEEAATLALAESADFPLSESPHDMGVLAADGKSTPEAPAQVHTIGIADAEARISELAAWLSGAGLVPEAIVPIEAPIFAAAARHALKHGGGDSAAVALFVGEHMSVLAAACRGRLRFAREIALGTESLVEALTREIRPAGGGTPITLTSEKARELLWRVGVPTREATVVESSGLTGDALLPVMQPVLQRWVVELRQSLRFGLEEAERAGATLHGLGAGSGVPRLTKVIADQMGLALAGATGAAGTNDSKAGAISSFLECPPGVGMLPRTLRTERAMRRFRRGLFLGAGAAVALIATDAVMTRMELTRRTADLAQAQTKLEESKSATALRDQVVAAQGGLVAARQRMAARLGSLPAWDAAMAMLAKQTPPTIKLSEVHLGFDSGHPYVRLAGRTVLGSQGDSNALLKSFMDTLAGVPIVRACRLGATQRSDTDAGPIQTFEMTLTLVEMPAGTFGQGVSVAGAATKENTP